jgi:hypothetical protein
MKTSALVVAGAFLAASACPGLAASVKKREAKQEHRIERGVQSGKITPKEEKRLENQQETIEREREQAWEDGKMSKREHRDIRHDQKRLGHDIRKKTENERRVR